MALTIGKNPPITPLYTPIRFGNQPDKPEKPPEDDRFESQKAPPETTTPEPVQQPKEPWYTAGCIGAPIRLVKRLWPFKGGAAAPPVAQTGEVAPGEKEKSVDKADGAKGVEVPQLPDEIKNQNKWRKAAHTATRILVNGFHVGAALFLMAGVPFLSGHLFIALGAVAGLHLAKYFLHRQFPGHTPTEEEMESMAKKMIKTYNRGRTRVSYTMRRTWGLKVLYKPFRKVSEWVGKFFNRSLHAMARLVYVTSLKKSMPDGFFNQLGWMAKNMSALALTMIFPATWWTRFFDMEDLQSISDAVLGVKRVPKPSELTPPDISTLKPGEKSVGVTATDPTQNQPNTGGGPVDPKKPKDDKNAA